MTLPAPGQEEAAAAEPPLLDPALLAELQGIGGDGEDLLVELFGLFWRELPGHLGRLDRALAGADPDGAARAAHALKGAAAAVGAAGVAAHAAAIEARARQGALADVPGLRSQLATACERLRGWLARAHPAWMPAGVIDPPRST